MKARRSIVLAGALAVATTGASLGLARSAPRPMSRAEITAMDPPTEDLVARVVPQPVKRAVSRHRERRRVRMMPEGERLIILRAAEKRLRKARRRLAIFHPHSIQGEVR